MARLTKPAIAVMDIRLAGARDGVDAALEIFQATGVRSIFATAHQDRSVRASAEAAHPLGWLAKPYDPESVVALIRTALRTLKA